ncbi:hypothetical protein PGO14_04840 [Klebsiella aerogenes]
MKKIILGLAMMAVIAPVMADQTMILTGNCTDGRHYSINSGDKDRLTFNGNIYDFKAISVSDDNKLVSVDYGYQIEGHRATLSIDEHGKEKIVFSDYAADGTRYRCVTGMTVRNN